MYPILVFFLGAFVALAALSIYFAVKTAPSKIPLFILLLVIGIVLFLLLDTQIKAFFETIHQSASPT